MAQRMAGKVALVTGAAQGIGRAVSLLLAREGACVAVTDLNAEGGEAVAQAIRDEGGRAHFWRLDVTREADVAAVLGQVAQHFGRLDVLVNNAGIVGPNQATHEVSESDWDAVMAVNVKGPMFCTKHAVPLMRAAGGGSIINLSSVFGLVGSSSVAAYHASKGALRLLTKSDALAYAEDGIRVNSVHPGFIWTPMLEQGMDATPVGREVAHSALVKLTPLGRLGDPEDVAYAVLFLACDEARFITGSELVVDGGYTAR